MDFKQILNSFPKKEISPAEKSYYGMSNKFIFFYFILICDNQLNTRELIHFRKNI